MKRILVIAAALLLAGCSAADKQATEAETTKQKLATPSGSLVLRGDSAPVKNRSNRSAATMGTNRETDDDTAGLVTGREYPAPEFFADGSINDGPDPFAGLDPQVLPIPIEDDPNTTQSIDLFAQRLRNIDAEAWAEWMRARSPRTSFDGPNEIINSMVRIRVQRCGGAKYSMSGVVVGPELVATTVHAIARAQRRVRVEAMRSQDTRSFPALIQYLDIADDVAILYVPGLPMPAVPMGNRAGIEPVQGLAFGLSHGGRSGTMSRTPVFAATSEGVLTKEQPDGFARQITDRSIYPVAGAIDTGYSGGVVAIGDADTQAGEWLMHGLLRARVPGRDIGGGVLIPNRFITQAVAARNALPQWFEHKPSTCRR